MNTFRSLSLPSSTRLLLPVLFLTAALVLAGSWSVPAAMAQDQVGMYWDADYTQDTITTDVFPSIFTGYLVLTDLSTTAGILGWELCADVDGPGQYLGWEVQGQGINAFPPPCFAVGLSPDPLPWAEAILLASFQFMVTEPLPVTLSLRPDYDPSVPDQMSYIPADDPGALLPLTTVTGQPEVAWVNTHIPNLIVSPQSLHFEHTPIGMTNQQNVTVTNEGFGSAELDIVLTGDCTSFALPGVSGPATVLPGETLTIPVSFTPTSTDLIFCNLSLGAGLDEVLMVGSGEIIEAEWQVPSEVDFGLVAVGSFVNRGVTVRNIGDVPFDIDPYIPDACQEFHIYSGNYPSTLQPGSQRTIYIRFQPSAVQEFTCNLDLGDLLPDVLLRGHGRDPQYDWNIFPPNIDFGSVGIGTGQTLGLSIQNTGELPLPVEPSIPVECSEFSITVNGEPHIIPTGQYHVIYLTYTPVDFGVDTCILSLGDVLPAMEMVGEGHEAVLDWQAPDHINFGSVPVGGSTPYSFTVHNTGDLPFVVAPSLPEGTMHFELSPQPPVELVGDQSLNITVTFRPLLPGAHQVDLSLGDVVPPVLLEGYGEDAPAAWAVHPTQLDFGYVYLGTYAEESVRLTNTGGTFLDLDVFLVDPDLYFTIIDGGGISQLPPSSFHDVTVRFQPQVEGFFVTSLNLGEGIDPVPVLAGAEATDDVCIVQPDSLTFGPIAVGASQTKFVQVTNNGNQILTLQPETNSSQFVCWDPDRNLGPGQSVYFSVLFSSPTPGTFTGTLDLGNHVCADVPLVGTATSGTLEGNDLVGIFFDPDFTSIEAETLNPNEIVEGYLVLTEPSEPTGVSAWELEASIDGNGQWLQWDIEGQHINAGQGDEFIVGIGGPPLPPADAILLATFQILIPEPYPNIVYLELDPIQQPSLPDQMAWAPGHDSGLLLPMYPLTGEAVVAGINWGPPVGIEHLPPRALITGRSIQLQWPSPGAGEGCHVYRRDEGGTPVRLTDAPLDAFGSLVTYTDQPQGYTNGAVLYYSYSVLTDGAEGPRSPETEVRLAGLPAARTKLLPNVPNPFNPMTEIRFELAEAEQVQVAVYDVTGRRLKVLADGRLGAGPHSRVWRGRDASGRQVPSGAYYVRLVTGRKVDHQKIMLLK